MAAVEVEVSNSSPLEIKIEAVKEWATAVLRQRKVAGSVGIGFVSLEEMRGLNRRYRGIDEPTDVLAFGEVDDDDEWVDVPEDDQIVYLGDVVIAPEAARQNALMDGGTLSHELRVLVVHGLLHLLGMDHEQDAGEMLSTQTAVVESVERDLSSDLV
ncbi:MAG: rRNA maturation RNase YbeY [Actinobacteria bacterium]|nr:rRNA maturation RNase YbeY [Actinomycetota bacterium]